VVRKEGHSRQIRNALHQRKGEGWEKKREKGNGKVEKKGATRDQTNLGKDELLWGLDCTSNYKSDGWGRPGVGVWFFGRLGGGAGGRSRGKPISRKSRQQFLIHSWTVAALEHQKDWGSDRGCSRGGGHVGSTVYNIRLKILWPSTTRKSLAHGPSEGKKGSYVVKNSIHME